MHVVCVHIHVKAENREAFVAATLDNARHTVEEAGALRFDVIQQADDPNRVMLYEVYRDENAFKSHKETAHYARWAAAVAPWMAEPRKGVKYVELFPTEGNDWTTKTGKTG
jgi:quinol monooxygenase YgiN